MTTWSDVTAGGSATTWTASADSRLTYGWIPFSRVTDLSGGIDFVPAAMDAGAYPPPYKASTDRPIQIWELSAITASGFTGETRP